MATVEQMCLHVDMEAGKTCPAAPEVLDRAAGRSPKAHAGLPLPEGAGRAVGQTQVTARPDHRRGEWHRAGDGAGLCRRGLSRLGDGCGCGALSRPCRRASAAAGAMPRSEPAMELLFAEIARDWGGLDVLCANAGIKGPTAAIEDMALEAWHQCLGRQPRRRDAGGASTAARLMKPAGQGVMIFTSSTSGLYGTPFRAPYVAAKWGVIGLMKTVAMELGPLWHPRQRDLPRLGQRPPHRPGDRGRSGGQGHDARRRAAGLCRRARR